MFDITKLGWEVSIRSMYQEELSKIILDSLMIR